MGGGRGGTSSLRYALGSTWLEIHRFGMVDMISSCVFASPLGIIAVVGHCNVKLVSRGKPGTHSEWPSPDFSTWRRLFLGLRTRLEAQL